MSTQPLPALSQRCHWNVNDVAPPVQVPASAVSSSPTSALPVTAGLVLTTGASPPETTSVAAEVADD